MEKQDRQYIIENIDKKSAKEIARDLNIKEKMVKEVIHSEEKRKKRELKREARRHIERRILLASAIVLIVLGFTAYGNSLNSTFIRDDDALIKDNVYVQDWSNVHKFFTGNIAEGSGEKWNSYRPLQMVTYVIDYALWKLDPFGYHLTNTLLHIAVALCLYWFINLLYGDRYLSFFASILFLLHPLHTGAISYIAGRADPLAATCMLLTFIFYIKYLHSEDRKAYILMLFAYIFALLSRENALILPLLLLLYHYVFKEEFELKGFLPIFCIAGLYIALRMTVLRPILFNITYSTTFLQRIPGFFVAMANYMRVLFVPLSLHAGYGNKVFPWVNPIVLAGIIITVAILVYAFRERKRDSFLLFSVCWFFIALLPQSNIFPVNAYMAEHWLYLPSIGFFLILARALVSLYNIERLKILAIVLLACLSGFYFYETVMHNNYWREPVVFYKRTIAHSPDNWRAHYNLGLAYREAGENEEAVLSYKRALEIKPNYVDAYNNLGNAYSAIGEYEEAKMALEKAIAINPNHPEVYYNLGNTYTDSEEIDKAIASYKRAIDLDPRHAKAYCYLGVAYNKIGDYREAVRVLKRAIDLNPAFDTAYFNLGNSYYDLGRGSEAVVAYKRAIKINPRRVELYNNLGAAYKMMKRNEEAIVAYRKALRIDPEYADAYNNIGMVYGTMGRMMAAIDNFKKAIELDPKHASAHNNLSVVYYGLKHYDLAVMHCDKALELDYEVHPDFRKLIEKQRKIFQDAAAQ